LTDHQFLRKAEVDDLVSIVVRHDVLCLEVPMDNLQAMENLIQQIYTIRPLMICFSITHASFSGILFLSSISAFKVFPLQYSMMRTFRSLFSKLTKIKERRENNQRKPKREKIQKKIEDRSWDKKTRNLIGDVKLFSLYSQSELLLPTPDFRFATLASPNRT
jgi:hypothetical protein